MSFQNKIAAALVAIGLGSTQGCGLISKFTGSDETPVEIARSKGAVSPVTRTAAESVTPTALPVYSLKDIKPEAASGEEIVKGNYRRLTGKEAKETPAELLAELQKNFTEQVSGAVAASSVLPLRETLLRSTQAVGLSTAAVVTANANVSEAIETELGILAIKGADKKVLLTHLVTHAANAFDLVTATANADASQVAYTVRGKTYVLNFDGDKLRDDAIVSPTGAPSGTLYDLVNSSLRLVTLGVDEGKLVRATSTVVSYTVGKDAMSKSLVEKLSYLPVKVVKGDKLDFFTGKFVGDKGLCGTENEESKNAYLVAINGRLYVIGEPNTERDAYFAAHERVALKEAKEGNVKRAIALLAMSYEGKNPQLAEKAVDAYTDKHEDVWVSIGSTANAPVAHGQPPQERSVNLVKKADANPRVKDFKAACKNGAITPTEAVELIDEFQEEAALLPLATVNGRTGINPYALRDKKTVLTKPTLFDYVVSEQGKKLNGVEEFGPFSKGKVDGYSNVTIYGSLHRGK